MNRREFFKYGAAAGVAGAASATSGCVTALKLLSGAPAVVADEDIPAGYEKIELDKASYSLSGDTIFNKEYIGKRAWFEGKPEKVYVDAVSNPGSSHKYEISFWVSGKNFYKVLWKASHATDAEALLKAKIQDSGTVKVAGYIKGLESGSAGIFSPEFVVIDGNKISF
jgi:hypothetical protein